MIWNRFFADLESQFAAGIRRQMLDQASELWEGEIGAISWNGRLLASRGQQLTCTMRSGTHYQGQLVQMGKDWLRIQSESQTWLLSAAAVASVRGLATAAHIEPDLQDRLGITVVLRALARRQVPLTIWGPGVHLNGQIRKVGADFVEVAATGQNWAVPLTSLEAVLLGA